MLVEESVKNIFKGLGADLCGIANIDRFENAPKGFHPRDIYKECNSVIVFAKRMPIGTLYVNSRIIYLKAMEEALKELDKISYLGSVMIEDEGGIAVPIPSDSPFEYWDEDKKEGKGLISIKHAAVLAGIGRIGKNTLLINKEYGNMIMLGGVLTNLNLNSDLLEEELCLKECKLCIENCPQKALDGTINKQNLCRQIIYSKNEKGFDICNCNICRKICPLAKGVK